MLAEALPRAVADGSDIGARGRMLWAATVAGLALHNCNTHMGHNISHALGSLAPVHHGLATGLALEVSLPWLVERPEGAANYAAASAALGGPAAADALPGTFAGLMRAAAIPRQLPAAAGGVTADALHGQMTAEANFGMSQNAACPIGTADLAEIAAAVLALPQEEMTA
jgi:alcohol dehydrogenase class IV